MSIIDNLKNFTNIEIIIILVIIVALAIIINSKIFKIIITSCFLLIAFLVFNGKFTSVSGLIDDIKEKFGIISTVMANNDDVIIINDKEYHLNDSNFEIVSDNVIKCNLEFDIAKGSVITINKDNKIYDYSIVEIVENKNEEYENNYDLILILKNNIIYANEK